MEHFLLLVIVEFALKILDNSVAIEKENVIMNRRVWIFSDEISNL